MGPVIQQVVLTFGVAASNGALTARAHVRHRVNMGNAKMENDENSDRHVSAPRLIARQRLVAAICGQHWSTEERLAWRIVCHLW